MQHHITRQTHLNETHLNTRGPTILIAQISTASPRPRELSQTKLKFVKIIYPNKEKISVSTAGTDEMADASTPSPNPHQKPRLTFPAVSAEKTGNDQLVGLWGYFESPSPGWAVVSVHHLTRKRIGRFVPNDPDLYRWPQSADRQYKSVSGELLPFWCGGSKLGGWR